MSHSCKRVNQLNLNFGQMTTYLLGRSHLGTLGSYIFIGNPSEKAAWAGGEGRGLHSFRQLKEKKKGI